MVFQVEEVFCANIRQFLLKNTRDEIIIMIIMIIIILAIITRVKLTLLQEAILQEATMRKAGDWQQVTKKE